MPVAAGGRELRAARRRRRQVPLVDPWRRVSERDCFAFLQSTLEFFSSFSLSILLFHNGCRYRTLWKNFPIAAPSRSWSRSRPRGRLAAAALLGCGEASTRACRRRRHSSTCTRISEPPPHDTPHTGHTDAPTGALPATHTTPAPSASSQDKASASASASAFSSMSD